MNHQMVLVETYLKKQATNNISCDDNELYEKFLADKSVHKSVRKTMTSRMFLSKVKCVCARCGWDVKSVANSGRRAHIIIFKKELTQSNSLNSPVANCYGEL